MFDLQAKADTPADENSLRLRLQTLLSMRFKLVSHHETREVPVYALTVGKNGVKFHELKERRSAAFAAGKVCLFDCSVVRSPGADAHFQ